MDKIPGLTPPQVQAAKDVVASIDQAKAIGLLDHLDKYVHPHATDSVLGFFDTAAAS